MTRNSKTGRGSGRTVLELAAAVFILLGPTVLGTAAGGWGLYAVFALTAAVFAVRLAETGRIHISVNTVLGGAALLYALFALIWASDRYSHVRLIFTLITVILFSMLAEDYFALEKPDRLGERLSMMALLSAFICALWNIGCWAVGLRFSLKEPFSAGLGSSDLLGLFMLVGLWCCLRVFYKKKKLNAGALVFILPMLFVLIMSRSLITGLAGGLFILWFSIKKKNAALTVLGGAAAVFSAIMLIASGTAELRPFGDGLICGLRNPGGIGGGGFILRQGELQSAFYNVYSLGLGAEIISSLGLPGLLIFLAAAGWMCYLAINRKSYFCALGAAVCIFAFFVPAGNSLAGLMLIAGVLIYGEWRQGRTLSLRLKSAGRAAVAAALAVIAVYGCLLGIGDGLKASGIRGGVPSTLAAAARLNPLDGDSSFRAAKAYRTAYSDSGEKNDIAYAEYYIKQAIRRCGETAKFSAEYAMILAAGGDLSEAVEKDGRAIELAPLNDEYKVMAAARLYELTETAQKGSLAAQNYHKRILELADAVSGMDAKKLINDYADRAQPYIRLDFGYEDTDTETGNGEQAE